MTKEDRLSAVVTALGVVLSVAGHIFAGSAGLPLWLDSLGTFLAAYVLGPIPGAAVGVSSNIIYAILNRGSFLYGFASLATGLIVGVMARRGFFKTLFGAATVGSVAALVSAVISSVISMVLYEGRTDNMWGDGVLDLLVRNGVPTWLGAFIGELYLDFVDRIVTAGALFFAIMLYQKIRDRRSEAQHKEKYQNDVAKGIVEVLLVAFVLGCVPGTAHAKTTAGTDFYSYVQEVYGFDNGLPCGEANAIAQTKDGILWIGTYAGLYRYNGREFRLMDGFDSVKNVNCLYVDEEGRLWIGTNDKGLSMCVEEHVRNVIDTSTGLPSDSVRSVVRCSDGTYYVGTSDGMQVFELNGGIQMLESIPEVMYAYSLSADDHGHVAAVSSAGDLFLLAQGKVVLHKALTPEDGAGSYTCCLFDKSGRLLAGTSEGKAFVYDISNTSFEQTGEIEFEGLNEINNLYYTDSGMLFGCADNGIGAFAADSTYTNIHTGTFNNSVDHMMIDYQGNYWFTSSRLGVLKMTHSTFSNLFEMAELERDVVNTTALWRSQLYVGTDEGLDIIDLGTGTSVTNDLTKQLDGIRIRCCFVDSRDHLWICSYGKGLLDVAPDGAVKTYSAKEGGFTDRVRTCVELPDKTLIASGDSGVALIRDDKVEQTIPYGQDFSTSQVLCFWLMPDGTVLNGTDGDGIVAVKDGKVAYRVTVDAGLSSNIILRIVPTLEGNGYYVVTSNGLCYMEQGEAGWSVRLLDNFPYFNNFDVQPGPNGEVFVLSSAGIYVVSEQDLLGGVDPLPNEILDARSGLGASITANAWICADEGMLYIATDQGVYRLDVSDYGEAKRSYHMKVSSIMLDGVEYKVERGTTFEIVQETMRMDIDAEVISYTLDDPLVSYQLMGYDSKPTTVRKSDLGTIRYTNIGPGDYVFKLQVLAGDGSVLEESRYMLHKDPMIYDNAWFQTYVFVVGALMVAWVSWFFAKSTSQRRLARQERELALVRHQVELADQTVMSIAHAVDAKDVRTSQHSHRVSQYSVLLAREMGFDEDECENLRRAALLHDIGKIGIPDRILNKPSRLTDEEYAIMKTHVTRGADILKDFTMVDHVVDGALYHHERYDGRGYVNGLEGEQIPLYGRIIAVADTFDAMTQNRVYRKGQDLDYVVGELERGKGTQFDPEIAALMLRLLEEGKLDHILYSTKSDNDGDEEASS